MLLLSPNNFGVWYTFDNSLGNIYELEISVTPNISNGNAISGDVVLAAYSSCGGTELECEVAASNPVLT